MPEIPTPDEDLSTQESPAPDAGATETAASPSDAPTPEPAKRQIPTTHDVIRAFLRPSRGQLAVGLLCLLLGFGGVLQVRAQQGTQAYAGLRRDDLVSMIDSLNTEHQRLTTEQTQLESQKQELQSGADKQKVATDAANQRVSTLSILAGTAPTQGPGVRIVISDPQGKVTPAMLLDAVEELRDAGAESIELNDQIRVVANTAFAPGPNGGIQAGGQTVTFPLQIEAIGDPATLEGGARFRGGIVSQVQAPTVGGAVAISQLPRVDITAVVTPPAYKHAKPAK